MSQTTPGGWPTPGDGFDWQPVGDRPIKANELSLDETGRLWAGGSTKIKRLDFPDDPADVWDELGPLRSSDIVHALGRGDTVIAVGSELRVTRDAGATWTTTLQDGNHRLAETTAAGIAGPVGALFAAEQGIWRSLDRGDTWQSVPFEDGTDFPTVRDLVAFPAGHPFAGHLLAVGNGGAWLSTTSAGGALRMRPAGRGATLVLEHAALLPSGRVLATGYYAGSGTRRAYHSDDGGETWVDGPALPEPADGIPGDAWLAVVGPETALAVGGRGVVYGTTDGGVTWSVVGRVPITDEALTSRDLMVASDGRLYVAVARAGSSDDGAWVYRTATPIVVSEGSGAPEQTELGMAVRPNPSSGSTVAVELSGDGGARAVVVDARGRTVAELWSGELRGGQRLELDTSGWAAGVYTVVVEAGGERTAEAFTVAR